MGVLSIPALASNMISIRKMDNEGVKTMFEKYTLQYGFRSIGIMRELRLELCTIFWVALLLMGATVLWLLKVEHKTL